MDWNFAVPMIIFTFLDFAEREIPELKLDIIAFFQLRISSMFIFGASKTIPFFFASFESSINFVKCKSAFDGIHPLFKHTPPSDSSLSINTTLWPKSAARNAAAYPPGPAPITTHSFWIISVILFI
jgi:hypothetical protein